MKPKKESGDGDVIKAGGGKKNKNKKQQNHP
jgi:hypothetical protein